MKAKLYGGGGEAVAHSRLGAPHGLGPAGAPVFRLRTILTMKISTLTAIT